MGKYDFRKLVTSSFIGSIPWCFALAYAGFRLGPYWKNIMGFFNGLDILIVAMLAFLFVKYFRKLRRHHKKR